MQHPTSRRSFITAGSLGFLGLSLRDALSAAAEANSPVNGKAKAVILFWLEGGPSHIDTWDPKTNSNFKPISTNVAGIRISEDRKSTRLNSSHRTISYAVFCLKKKLPARIDANRDRTTPPHD